MQQILAENLDNTLKVFTLIKESLLTNIIQAGEVMVEALKSGGKLLVCGNGGSAADAQHFTGEILCRFESHTRPPLPALALAADIAALTAIANDFHYEEIFSKPLEALADPRDVLVILTTSGNSTNLVKALKVAQAKGMKTIALTGKTGGLVAGALGKGDMELRIPSNHTARIQEAQQFVIHSWCQMIDHAWGPQ